MVAFFSEEATKRPMSELNGFHLGLSKDKVLEERRLKNSFI